MTDDIGAKDRLLAEIEALRHSDVKSKIKAVDMVFDNFQTIPSLFSVMKERANKSEPKEVRLRVALRLRTVPLRVREYRELVKILSAESDQDILKYLRRRTLPTNPVPDFQTTFIQNIQKFNKSNIIQSATEQLSKDISNIVKSASEQQTRRLDVTKFNMPNIIQSATEEQRRHLQDITRYDMFNILKSAKWPSLLNDYLTIAKPYASVLDINKIFTLPLRNQLKNSVGYYSENDLETLKSTKYLHY